MTVRPRRAVQEHCGGQVVFGVRPMRVRRVIVKMLAFTNHISGLFLSNVAGLSRCCGKIVVVVGDSGGGGGEDLREGDRSDTKARMIPGHG